MKKLITVLLLIGTLLSACLVCTVTAGAEPLDAGRSSSLTLHFKHGEENYEGLSVRTYKIAELSADGDYVLCGEFAAYPVNVYSVKSQAEWRKITSTLAAYIAADGISPDHVGETDSEGRIRFSGISTGLYLTLSIRHETPGLITVFEDFITAVPGIGEDGEYSYDVTALPKQNSYIPAPAEVEFKVLKLWKDTGAENKRPDGIEVDILREGELVEKVTLSPDNDWCYKWKAPDDKSAWYAVERNVPEGYKVTVTSDGRTIVITNSYEAPQPPPDTGDTESLLQYTLMLCLSGLALIALGVVRLRMEK